MWAVEQRGKTGEWPMSSYFEAGWVQVVRAVAGVCSDTAIANSQEGVS
jgi:hypothetical protein